jgi:hypothetical protein
MLGGQVILDHRPDVGHCCHLCHSTTIQVGTKGAHLIQKASCCRI